MLNTTHKKNGKNSFNHARGFGFFSDEERG
jgi:hypothetical protein